MTHQHLQDAIYEEACGVVKKEVQSLCSTSDPSILRKTSPKDLAEFKWDSMNEELINSSVCDRFSE